MHQQYSPPFIAELGRVTRDESLQSQQVVLRIDGLFRVLLNVPYHTRREILS